MLSALGASFALVLASVVAFKLRTAGSAELAWALFGCALLAFLYIRARSRGWLDRIPAIVDAALGRTSSPPALAEGHAGPAEAIPARVSLESSNAPIGLANRLVFHESVERELCRLRRGLGQTFAVLFLDLDHFKAINQTLGHKIGDLLLQAVAERLQRCAAESELVAHLGSDEFAIMHFTSRPVESAAALARNLIQALSGTHEVEKHQVVLGVSIGIVFAPNDGADANTLLKHAEQALFRAQSEGRATYRFFEPEMEAEAQADRALELDLRAALSLQQFELHYQPILDANSSEIIACEAVLRWVHPERGYVPPLKFVPLAERIGLIAPIGEWIVRQACARVARWPTNIRVAVNISPVQFKLQNISTLVMQALASAGLAASRLELEITESVLLEDNPDTLSRLHQLRAIGVRIALDDFGTGYSSLSYLRKFPFSKIKIDQSFVREVVADKDCQAIVRAIVTLGRSIGMRTTAEGVESLEQFDKLRAKGCDEVQGYLFSPPLPEHEFLSLLGIDTHSRRMSA